jgi:hypothetical protein
VAVAMDRLKALGLALHLHAIRSEVRELLA